MHSIVDAVACVSVCLACVCASLANGSCFGQGSKRLAGPGKVNVYGESTWDGIMSHMPAFVNDWSHPVKPDPARPPDHWLSGEEGGLCGCISGFRPWCLQRGAEPPPLTAYCRA
jgi:hypothetical protein